MQKDTARMVEELALCSDFKTFYGENQDNMVTTELSDMLCELLSKKNIKKTHAIKNSELSETFAYQIFSGVRKPERNKLLCLAIGMELDVDEVQSLLKCAGYPQLYVKIPFDTIVLYGIIKRLTIIQINEILYDYGLETLG